MNTTLKQATKNHLELDKSAKYIYKSQFPDPLMITTTECLYFIVHTCSFLIIVIIFIAG